MRSLTFSATNFVRESRSIAKGKSLPTLVRQSPPKRQRPCETGYEAGGYSTVAIWLSQKCLGFTIRSSEAGSNTTGGTTAPHFTRWCVNWTVSWSAGPDRNTRSCAIMSIGQGAGWRRSPVGHQISLPTGSCCVVAPRWEPYEARVSRTVLRAPRGEIPRGDSPTPDPKTSSLPALWRRAKVVFHSQIALDTGNASLEPIWLEPPFLH
jgi:hypothetical protein